VFGLIERLGQVSAAQMHRVFNMGTGFVCVVPAGDEAAALDAVRRHHPGAAAIGTVTGEAGLVRLPEVGLLGDAAGFRAGQ
jgi:phosphoribosylformylglycinamidine cyclo-ligase